MNEAIVLLLLLWAVLLVPGMLRSRNSSPHTTVGGFERAMDVLRAKPGQGRQLMVPSDAGRIVGHVDDHATEVGGRAAHHRNGAGGDGRRGEDPVMVRRRGWFLRLLAGTGAGFVLALVVGGWMWLPFASLVVVVVGYTALLRHLKLQRDQARRVVRGLDVPQAAVPVRDADLGVTWADDQVQAAGGGADPVIHRAPVEGGGMALQSSVRLRRWDG